MSSPFDRALLLFQQSRFDLAEKAVALTAGWVYIGDRFIDDFLDVEATAGFELLFPDPPSGELRPVFLEIKQHRAQNT